MKDSILFVDDDYACQMLTQLTIRGMTGYNFHAVDSVRNALSYIESNFNKLRLIISDINLPGSKDGYHLYNFIKSDQKFKHIDFIFQSGFTFDNNQIEDKFNNDIKILYKPYKQKDLLKMVYTTLEGIKID